MGTKPLKTIRDFNPVDWKNWPGAIPWSWKEVGSFGAVIVEKEEAPIFVEGTNYVAVIDKLGASIYPKGGDNGEDGTEGTDGPAYYARLGDDYVKDHGWSVADALDSTLVFEDLLVPGDVLEGKGFERFEDGEGEAVNF